MQKCEYQRGDEMNRRTFLASGAAAGAFCIAAKLWMPKYEPGWELG